MPQLRVLVLRNSKHDSAAALANLRSAGYEVACRRVDLADLHSHVLDEHLWDLVLGDAASLSSELLLSFVRRLPAEDPTPILVMVDDGQPMLPLVDAFGGMVVQAGNLGELIRAIEHRWVSADMLSLQSRAMAAERDAAQYRRAFELTSDFAYSFQINADGRILPESRLGAIESHIGYTPEEFSEHGHWFGLTHPEDKAIALQQMSRLLAGHHDVSEMRIVAKDGKVHWVRKTGHPVRAATDGRVVQIYGTLQDITQRKLAEEALRASEERFRAILEQTSEVIFLLQADGLVTYVSPSLTRIMGYAPEEVVGHRGYEFIHPDDLLTTAEKMVEVVANPSVPVHAMFRARHKDGLWRWVEAIATNLFDVPGVNAILSTQRDITVRKAVDDLFAEPVPVRATGT